MVRMKTFLLSLAVSGCFSFAAVALASERADLLENWYLENQRCRGGSGDQPDTWKACERRSKVNAELKKNGCRQTGESWVCKGRTPVCQYSEAEDRTSCK